MLKTLPFIVSEGDGPAVCCDSFTPLGQDTCSVRQRQHSEMTAPAM